MSLAWARLGKRGRIQGRLGLGSKLKFWARYTLVKFSFNLKNSYTKFYKALRTIQFVILQLLQKKYCYVCLFVVCPFSLKVLFLLFTKVLGQNDQVQKYSLEKSNERQVVICDFGSEINKNFPMDSYFVLLLLAHHPTVHTGGVSRWRVCGYDCSCQ